MKIAIVKPDHIGDLVLSSPAIRAIMSRYSDAVLFVASRNLELARYLFGDIDVRALDLPHLAKDGAKSSAKIRYRDFDLVAFLRRDDVLSPDRIGSYCNEYLFYTANHNFHQSILDYTVASWLAGEYDIDDLFFGTHAGRVQRKATKEPSSIGLCIGTGFHANRWPINYWVGLGRELLARGHEVTVICGPSERDLGALIIRSLGIPNNSLVCGGSNFAEFYERVDEADWVIAADGGTAHLCSIVTPVLSIFGASPFRRYAPFGLSNRLLTLDLSCSPCSQYASRSINGCLSNECVVSIDPSTVLPALARPYLAVNSPYEVNTLTGCKLYFGTSHLDRRLTQHAARVGA